MFEILMWLKCFSDLIPNKNKIFFLSFVLKYMHAGLLNTVNSSLIVIYFYEKILF